ncbi:TetR/AcrR family transcriptional regulator [Amycolatopsis viridis]|uniref:AcrR family transcriptional regulator n=1 Tax=Amycolatopsis viridis TaxID=185678 RepID=A0ABX0SW14_9PSEU|nr:TetR/AcrR family transcriptional regulator [Amycolatopsis viridis]NIH80805.1 AcrR family transcriptional regulator [Amycolatopsis viridis]
MRGPTVAGQERRTEILRRAAPLFAQKGISGCTVRDIAEVAGILSGSLYHYFDSKDTMVSEIVSAYLRSLVERYEITMASAVDGRARLHALILDSLEASRDHPHASEIYQGNRGYFAAHEQCSPTRELATRIFETWQEAITLGVEEGAFRRDVNPRVFHRFLRDAVFLSPRWFHPSEAYGIEQLAADTARVFLDGFTAP